MGCSRIIQEVLEAEFVYFEHSHRAFPVELLGAQSENLQEVRNLRLSQIDSK